MIRSIGMCIVFALLAGGCAHWPEQDTSLTGAQAEFKIPPKKMLADIKQIVTEPPLSLGVVEEGKGSILTGYQSFPGDWHIARRWQERTQYRIQVIPDFDEPTAICTVQVRERTETRAADGMKWAPLQDATRPDRAREMLKTIQAKFGQ
jgi:hypothetical protein